jgi:hypothetical protein
VRKNWKTLWNLSKVYRKLGVRSRADWPRDWPPGGAGRVNPSRLADFAAPAPALPSGAAPHRPNDETEAAMRARLTHLINRLRLRRATGSRAAWWPPVEPVVPTLRGWPVDPPSR